MKKLLKTEYLFLFLLIGTYFVVFSVLSILRHQSLNSTYLDLGLESQAVWNTSQSRFFETSFGDRGYVISALSYHFTPIILLIAPFYRLFPSPETLLMLQTLFLSLGAVAVYLIAWKILGSPILSLAFAGTYLLYPAMEYSNLSDFHYVTLATTFLLFCFYFLIERRWFWFILFLFLAVLAKENMAIVAALFGAYIFLTFRERKTGAAIFLIFVSYFLLSTFYIMPRLGGGYGAIGRYSTLTSDPIRALLSLFNPDKIKYLFHLLISVGFLPLLAPGALVLAGSEILLNLLSDYNPQWQVKFHYTAATTPFVFISAIYGAREALYFLEKRGIKHRLGFISLYLVCISLIWNVIHSPSPINYKFDPSKFTVSAETRSALKSLSLVTDYASVSAMNNLGAHLTNRRQLFRFPINYLNADYVAVDPGALSDFDLSQVTLGQYSLLISDLLKGGKFEMITSQPRLLLYKKKL